ncbi:CHAT domain-containing protein, partial [Vibrio nigripulchritudo]
INKLKFNENHNEEYALVKSKLIFLYLNSLSSKIQEDLLSGDREHNFEVVKKGKLYSHLDKETIKEFVLGTKYVGETYLNYKDLSGKKDVDFELFYIAAYKLFGSEVKLPHLDIYKFDDVTIKTYERFGNKTNFLDMKSSLNIITLGLGARSEHVSVYSSIFENNFMTCNTYKKIYRRARMMVSDFYRDTVDKYYVYSEILKDILRSCKHSLSIIREVDYVSKLGISLGVDYSRIEEDLLFIESKLKDHIDDDFLPYYYILLSRLMDLYYESGKEYISKIYARKIQSIYKRFDNKAPIPNDIKENSILILGGLPFDEASIKDIKASSLIYHLSQDTDLVYNHVLTSRSDTVLANRYLRNLLDERKYNDILDIVEYIHSENKYSRDTIYISTFYVETLIIGDIARVKSGLKPKFSKDLLLLIENSGIYLSLESEIIIYLLNYSFFKGKQVEVLKIVNDKLEQIFLNYGSNRSIKAIRELESAISYYLVGNSNIENYEYKEQIISLLYSLERSNPTNIERNMTIEKPHIRSAILEASEIRNLLELGGNLKTSDYKSAISRLNLLEEDISNNIDYSFSIKLDNFTKNLSPEEVIIYSTDVDDLTVIVCITDREIKYIFRDKKVLSDYVLSHRTRILSENDPIGTGKKLYDLIFEEILPENTKAINFYSYGVLDDLPISTLYRGGWFINSMSLRRYSSFMRIGMNLKVEQSFDKRLVIAAPEYSSNPFSVDIVNEKFFGEISSLPFLRDTLDEAILLVGEEFYEDNDKLLLTGRNANEEMLSSALITNWELVVFSTHTLFPNDNNALIFPGLALSKPTSVGFDGFLSSIEIAESNFNGSWLVLAACETASSSQVKGSFNSLLNSFNYAGANGVVATHWKINSNRASNFISDVAKHLNDSRLSLPEAITLSQKKYSTKKSKSPLDWAAWEIYW